eukprot:TRINITY_DN774113_c0_g1_i1.p1 TRINITY_DN774113_c0_g1~~TRINITY_DN774113_c0_g1_i1.p1  ORF type:complete len:260 (-),score=104.54 TRINITY_DN774113_c0_g1_i1:81-785(-)
MAPNWEETRKKRVQKHKAKRRPGEKIFLNFDEDDRAEYLTGFHKRKEKRRLQAQIQLQETTHRKKTENRKAIDFERRENVKDMGPLPDEKPEEEEVEDENKKTEVKLKDDFTKKTFGFADVVVTTTVGLGSDEENIDDELFGNKENEEDNDNEEEDSESEPPKKRAKKEEKSKKDKKDKEYKKDDDDDYESDLPYRTRLTLKRNARLVLKENKRLQKIRRTKKNAARKKRNKRK